MYLVMYNMYVSCNVYADNEYSYLFEISHCLHRLKSVVKLQQFGTERAIYIYSNMVTHNTGMGVPIFTGGYPFLQ